MRGERFSENINKSVLYIIAAALSFLVGIGQIVMIIFEHTIYSGGVWYMLCAMWFLLGGLMIYKLFSNSRRKKEEAQKIEEFKKLYNLK